MAQTPQPNSRIQILGLLDSLEQISEEQRFTAISEPNFDLEAVEVPKDGPMTFEFTMMDKAKIAAVDCEISSNAMDQLAGSRGTMPDEREAQFHALRDAIERIASDLFEEGISSPDGAIRIFYHHVR